MPSLRYTVTSLATFGATVSGVAHSYDVDATPEQVTRDKLPALIIDPDIGSQPGYGIQAFMAGQPKLDMSVTQYLLFKPTNNLPLSKVVPDLLTMADHYIIAARTQKYLDTQLTPKNQIVMNFKIEIGQLTYAAIQFHVLRCDHKWSINL